MFPNSGGQKLRNLLMRQWRVCIKQMLENAFPFLVSNLDANRAYVAPSSRPVSRRFVERLNVVSLQFHFINERADDAPMIDLLADDANVDYLPRNNVRGKSVADTSHSLANVPIVRCTSYAKASHVVRAAHIWFARYKLGDPFIGRQVTDKRLPSITYGSNGVPRAVD